MGTLQGRRRGRPIYVEIPVRCGIERLWQLTQNTALHPRWDLRFSAIIPTDPGADGTQCFRYEFRLPFHTIRGTGTSLGTRGSAGGHSTSVLKFTTGDPLSPIGTGAGYWRYLEHDGGVRFITSYNYQPGWGVAGRVLDRRIIRPALGWATALSFDRLRLWAESGIDPAAARTAWLADAAARTAGWSLGIGLLAGAFRRPGTVAPLAAGVIGGLLAGAAWAFPPSTAVPRAGRCLRSEPDRGPAHPPASPGLAEAA